MKAQDLKVGDKIVTTDEGKYRGSVTGFECGMIRIRLDAGETLRDASELEKGEN